jgi:uncharacterized RDD family membrane protein YckC
MENETEQNKYEYAGFWIRTGASIIDGILLAMITIPIMIMVYGLDEALYSEKFILGAVDFFLNITLPLFATVILWMYKSATPGKMILGLSVVDQQTGNKLTIGQSFGRYFAYIIAIIPLLLGIFWVAWDKKKQGWHDKLAKTVVIRNKKRTEDVKFI